MMDRPIDDITCTLFRELLEWKKHPMKNYPCPKCAQKLKHYMRHSEELNGITKLHGIWGCSGWADATCFFPMCERNFTEYATLRTIEQFAAGYFPPPPLSHTTASSSASTSKLPPVTDRHGSCFEGNAPPASSESRTVEAPGSLRTPFFPDDRPATDDEQGLHEAVAMDFETSNEVNDDDHHVIVPHEQEAPHSPTNLSEAETSKLRQENAKQPDEIITSDQRLSEVSENDAEGKMRTVAIEQSLKERKGSQSPTNLSEAETSKQQQPVEQDAIMVDIIGLDDMDIIARAATNATAQKEQMPPRQTPTSLMLQQLTKHTVNKPPMMPQIPQIPKRGRGGRTRQNAPPAQSSASADQLKRAAFEHAQLLLKQKQKHAAEIIARNSRGGPSAVTSPSHRPPTARQAQLEMEKKKRKRGEQPQSQLSNSPSRALTEWMLKEKAVNRSPQTAAPKLDAVYVRKELSDTMRRATSEVLRQSVPVADLTNRLSGWTPVASIPPGSGGLTPSAITPSASPPPATSGVNANRTFQDPELNALVQRKMAQVKQAFAPSPPPTAYGIHHVQSVPVMSANGMYQLDSVPSYQLPTTHAGPWLAQTPQTPTTNVGDWTSASFEHVIVDDWATPTALTTMPLMATSSPQTSTVDGALMPPPAVPVATNDDADKELDQSWEMDRGMTISEYFGL